MSGPVAAIDTSIFVGAKNPDEPEHAPCERLLELAHHGRFQGVISTVTVAEVCAGYYFERDEAGRAEFLNYLRSAGTLQTVSIGIGLADLAARLRAETALKLPDALILASAIDRSAEFLITHDQQFAKARSLLTVVSAQEFLRKLEARSRA